MLLKFEMLSMRIGQVIRLWNINFSETLYTSQMISIFLKHSVHLKWYQIFWKVQEINERKWKFYQSKTGYIFPVDNSFKSEFSLWL